MSKTQDSPESTQTSQANEFTQPPGDAPKVTIEVAKGTLRYRTGDGTDLGKKVTAFAGQSVWLEADKDGQAEATVTTEWPIEGGREERTITEPGLIYG